MVSEGTAGATTATPVGRRLHLRQSVRVRITLAAVVVTAVAVGIAGWLLVLAVESTQLSQLRDEITSQLDEVSAQLQAGRDPEAVVQESATWPFVQVSYEQGNSLAVSSSPLELTDQAAGEDESPPGSEGAHAGPVERHESAEATATSAGPGPGPDGGEEDRAESAPVDPPTGEVEPGEVEVQVGPDSAVSFETVSRTVETPTGTMTVTTAAPVEQVERSVDAVRRALVVGLPLLVVLVAAIAWMLVGRALRPVEEIRAEVDEITGSTMHRRVPEPPTGDEIGRLARTMNAMLGRLDTTATRQRQFVSDASHELRSPVAAIRTGLEVARRNPARANWPVVADTALAEESRLEALLDDLLLLAGYDENGAAALPRSSVDLAAVVIAEAERPRQVAVQVAGGGNGSEASEASVVQGDADQLARVVGNLLDNAARHARSLVQVDVARPDGTVRLTVDDDGPGIPADDRERVFERFTRLDDDSRARTDGGSGLGLAVVRSLVTRHHGAVWAEDSPLGGARLVVDLPAPAHQAAD